MIFLVKGISCMAGFAIPIVYSILLLFDSLIYSIAAYCLQAFFQIAALNINSGEISGIETINAIMYRMMVLGGIYALFRLGISLINYIVKPTETDKAPANGKKIVTNVIIAVILLASSKFVFEFLYDFSSSIIKQNTIPQIVYGPETEFPDYSDPKMSKSFVNNVFLVLFKSDNYQQGNDLAADAVLKRVSSGESSILALSDYAYNANFQYLPILTTVVGIMLIYYFGLFAIELGTRLFKLFVLQVISPIPIILSIDPNQNKNLENFGKTYIVIYLSLFIRILTVYIAFVLLNIVEGIFGQFGKLSSSTTTSAISLDATFLVEILLIIACFQAAKELPKLIEDALGTKLGLGDSGGGFKAALMGAVGGTTGFLAGSVAGGISGGPGGIVGGALSGMWNGATKGAAAKNAVELAGVMGGNVRGSFLTGAHIAGAGGLGAFAVGGVENFFGGQRRDKATVANFDKDIASKEKMIQKTKNKLESSNHANGLRSNIENTLEKGFVGEKGSLSDYMSTDAELSKLQEAVRINNDNLFYQKNPEYRQIDLDRVAERKTQLTEAYNLEKESYIKNKMDTFSVDGSIPENNFDQSLKEMIKEYNDYVDENGYDNRKISGYDSYNDSKTQSEKAEMEYQTEIAKYEKEKKEIEDKKKAFVESAAYNRRNKRNEEKGSVWRKYRTSDSNANDSGNTE